MLFNPAEFIRNSQTGLFQNIDEMTAPGFQVVQQQQTIPNRFTPTFVPQFRPETPAPQPIRPITDSSVRRPVPQETALFPEIPLAPVIDSAAPERRPSDTPAPVEVPSPARRPIGTPAPVEVPAPSRRPVQNPQRQRRPVETPAPRPVAASPAPVQRPVSGLRDFANFQAFQPIQPSSQPEQQQVFEPAPVTTRPVESLPPVTPFTVFNQQVRPQPVQPQVQPQAVQVPIQLEEVRSVPSGANQQVLVPLEPTQPEPVVTTTTAATTTTTTETTATTTTTARPTRTRFRTRQRVAFR